MALEIICDENDPHQNGRIISFDSQGSAIDQEFIRGDINLALTIRPVKESASGERPWDDDFIAGDTFQVSIGNPDQPPTGGTFDLAALGGTITSSSVANPSIIVHATSAVTLATGNTVYFVGHVGAVPDINGAHVITVTDSTHFTIPVNVTTGGTGGTFYLASAGLTGLAFPITPSALAAALTVAPLTAPAVTSLTTGVYEARWGSGVAAPTFYSPINALAPASGVAVIDDSTATVQVRIFDLKQQPVAYAEPATALTAAGVTASIKQAGSGTENKIYAISLNAPGTYGGTYSLGYTGVGVATITVGVFDPTSTADAIQSALENISAVGDFAVNKDTGGIVTIEMRGTQGLSNSPVITAANINLLAPVGVKGIMALNTTNLYRAFWNTSGAQLNFTLEIRRSRASGEQSTIFQHSATLKRNLIDGVIVPTVLPAYYTTAQADAAIATAIASSVSGFGTMATQDASAVGISGGSIDSVTITNTTGPFSVIGDITASGDINALLINGTGLSGSRGMLLASSGNDASIVVGTDKSVWFTNTITFTGTDGITINLGTTSGTLLSGAFAAAVVSGNATHLLGLTAVNGSSAAFMRSDAAPALDQGIIPTWTGAHVWSATATFNGLVTVTAGFTLTASTFVVAPGTLGTINNCAIGGVTPAGSQFTSTKIGPSATPGTTINRFKFGTASAMVAGVISVGEGTITANTLIVPILKSLGTVAAPKVITPSRSVGVSFTFTSADNTDTSIYNYILIEP